MKLVNESVPAALVPKPGQKLVAPNANSTIAFAFDIDGVLVKGTHPLDHARETIALLQRNRIPFIFLTNGGGHSEADHARKLAARLDIPVDHKQFVQSHSPYHTLVPEYGDKPILVLGGTGDSIRKVAHSYGFNKVITTADIFVLDNANHPFPEMTREHHLHHGRQGEDIPGIGVPLTEVPIAAILVWSSPRDWCLDLQITLDLLLSAGGKIHTRSELNGNRNLPQRGFLQDNQPKIFFCNPDFEWATNAAQPRVAQGSWRTSLLGLWAEATRDKDARDDEEAFRNRVPLPHEVCGKPTKLTYDYGETVLMKWNEQQQHRLAEEAEEEEKENGGAGHDADNSDASTTVAEGVTLGTGPSLLEEAANTVDHVRRPGRVIKTVYMIGDNPESDIKGAREYESQHGLRWRSVLVETGVHKSGTKPAHQPDKIAKDVQKAVDWALKEEGYVYVKDE